ncbi:homoserine O-succinyltransferase [Komagataeibacter rhaeticus]|nr:homoserine O-succinyltransferase [Komagataeibacter rhaeticus]
MPDKIRTETQIARLVGATPLQVELTLVCMGACAAPYFRAAHGRVLPAVGGRARRAL